MPAARKKSPTKKATSKKAAPNKAAAKKRTGSPRYGPAAAASVETEIHEMNEGTLRSGGSGKKVTSRKQAVAIGLSKARRAGAKVPKKP